MVDVAENDVPIVDFGPTSAGHALVEKFLSSVPPVNSAQYRLQAESLGLISQSFGRHFPNEAREIQELCASFGWVVVRTGNVRKVDELCDLTLASGALSCLGRAIQPYRRATLWKPLGVDLSAGSGKATAADFIPLHIDLVNSSLPPDYSCLFTERSDPAGGGESIVARFDKAIDDLDECDRANLAEPVLIEGEFYDIDEVGDELNPLPVLRGEDSYIRFTAKWPRIGEDSAVGRAWSALNESLMRSSIEFKMLEGDCLIVDQREVAHGRLSLGGGQEELSAVERRLIHQTFAREW